MRAARVVVFAKSGLGDAFRGGVRVLVDEMRLLSVVKRSEVFLWTRAAHTRHWLEIYERNHHSSP